MPTAAHPIGWPVLVDPARLIASLRLWSSHAVPMDIPDFNRSELIPAVAQDAESGDVLMVAWMNREAWEETCRTRRACYFSRSRQKLWRKGEQSGHYQEVREILVDCDADTLVLKVIQHGAAACHVGYRSCFFRRIDCETGEAEVVAERVFDPAEVYGSEG